MMMIMIIINMIINNMIMMMQMGVIDLASGVIAQGSMATSFWTKKTT